MNEITTIDQLDACLNRSSENPLFIFKHSTRCPISSGANARIAKLLLSNQDENGDLPEFYLLKVVESRALSNALADKLHVPHQSPQLLLIDKGKCTWYTSHHNINANNIEKAIQSTIATDGP